MPVGRLIRKADSQAMQQQALDILSSSDIIALTFNFLYPFQKMKWWMGFLDGLELLKLGFYITGQLVCLSMSGFLMETQ